MNQASVQSALSISPTVGSGVFNWDGNELTFDPYDLFDENKQYTVTISSGAKDTEGNSLIEFYWDFTTEIDASVKIPDVLSYEPTGNIVPIDTVITVEFNVRMEEGATENAISITYESGTEVEGDWDWDLDTKTGFYTGIFDPTQELKYSTQYTVNISTDAMSQDGEHLQNPEQWSFITVEKLGPKEPSLFSWETLEPIITGLTILATILLALLGFLKLRKKRGKLAEYLEQIDETYDEYKHDYQACVSELLSLRDKIKIEVKQGNLEEGHFLILDKKIDDYLRDLRIAKKEGKYIQKEQPSLDEFEKKSDKTLLDFGEEEAVEVEGEIKDEDIFDDDIDDEY
jgi:hypothetical protein